MFRFPLPVPIPPSAPYLLNIISLALYNLCCPFAVIFLSSHYTGSSQCTAGLDGYFILYFVPEYVQIMKTLTNYKDQSPSSETGSHFSGQNTGLVSLLKNQNINYPVSIIVSYPEVDGSVHTFIPFTLRPILILPSSLCLETKVILPFLFSG